MKLCVIGTGYVGLVAGACFAEYGNKVICVDNNEAKVKDLIDGKIPIYEPGLEEIVIRNHQEGRLDFTTDLAQGVADSEIVFIAVGTPSSHDGKADLSMVLAVAEEIGKALNGPKVVVNKSTVPVGTGVKVREAVAKHAKHEFHVVSNPEFLKEGVAVNDFMRPERIIVGADDPAAKEVMEELYNPFVANGNPLYFMSVKSAEVTKYACNAFLATKISFANEVANLCDAVGATYHDVRIGMGSDSRIGKKFLYAGVGYGGSCFPKDVRALVNTAKEYNVPMRILDEVEDVNEHQKRVLLKKMEDHYGSLSGLKGKKVAVWGLAFKPGTDDMREAPSIPIIKELTGLGVEVHAFDPVARHTAGQIFGDSITYEEHDEYAVLDGAAALVIVTDWQRFRRPDFDRIKSTLGEPVIFDGRNLFVTKWMKDRGFTYHCIGNNA